MKLFSLYIKSHCEWPDFEQEFEARNKIEAIKIADRLTRGEFETEFLNKNIKLCESKK